jgi:hypothetical protein
MCRGRKGSNGAVRLASLVAAALVTGLAGSLLGPVFAGTPAAPAPSAKKPTVVSRSPYAGARSQRAELYYSRLYGVDQMHVRWTASGSSLEFRYRVLDADKAAVLQDKRLKPVLIDQKTGAHLTVPTMEKIGELRQTAEPEVGREYWMIFANPGKLVKPGSRVDILAGPLRVSGLFVE